ncbi:hypothetical protein CLOP_g18614 [Closterium sp. NIES-67]|nr:hypothetical protein CLOP_g18614 [Closterium sp. NIES-67]
MGGAAESGAGAAGEAGAAGAAIRAPGTEANETADAASLYYPAAERGANIPNNSMLGVSTGPGLDTLMLPESFFPSPAVECSTGGTQTDGAAATAVSTAATAAFGTYVDVVGKPQTELQGISSTSSSRGFGRWLSPKRSHDEVMLFEAAEKE